ncbi:MAG: efflux RND transporter permease subunit, partial [Motiliproteus sp.]|nr:efflux RND transporter permease subunit [Motiliproteus sp.]
MFERLIQRGTLTTVVVLIICVIGIVSATRIPVQMIPDLDVRTISIRTAWPGATPQDVEKEILIEQEEYLRSIPSLTRMIATANFGRASIELEFPHGVDINETLIRVTNALSQVPSYPNNVKEPRIYATSFSANSFMYFRVATLPGNPRGLNMVLMKDFLEDNVQTQMENIPGVSRVNVFGGADRQIQILIDPAKLSERQLTVTDIRNSIRSRNRDVSGGEIESGKRRYLLRTIGRFQDLEDLRQLILSRRGDALIRLRDVAQIQLDHSELGGYSYTDGHPGIWLSVRREDGANVINIKKALLPTMDRLNQEVLKPAGLQMRLIADDVGYVQASLKNVWKNLLLGALLASTVLYLFLRSGRATLVGVMGIPVCTIAAFLGLLLAERTINVISLAGVAFALGMTLDNSIVVLESIELARQRGLNHFRSAVEGVRKVWPAVLASTLTTILVFIPILFIEQEAGQLYSDIALAVSAAILASMLIAITVLPTACARMSFRSEQQGLPPDRGLRGWILDGIDWLCGGPLRRSLTLVVSVVVSVTIFLTLTPAAEYLPEGEEPKTFARLHAPPGYNLKTMAVIADDLQEYFLPFLEHESSQFEAGETKVPALKYLNLRVDSGGVRIISQPKDPNHIHELMDAIQERYRTYPGMRSFVARGSIITSNNGGTRSVNLDIAGADLATLYEVALTAYRRAEEVFDNPRIRATPPSLSLSQPLVEMRPDWDRAAELGVNASDIGFTVSALTDGAFVDEFLMNDDKVDIYLYSQSGTASDLDSLSTLQIFTPNGTVLPLTNLISIEETVDSNSIRRVDGRRMVTLSIIPPQNVALETAVERVRKEVVQHLRDTGEVPLSVNMSISGASDQLDATREALSSNYLVAVVIIYLLLVAIFNHWGYPLLIMITIPLGVAGGIFGLWAMNWVGAQLPQFGLPAMSQSFDMIAMLGFLILMGTVVNNPILIVHQAMNNVREASMGPREAVRDAVTTRLRPIAMSTLTTVFGLAPLVFLPGEGAELYRGVGAIVLFGLLGTAVVSL